MQAFHAKMTGCKKEIFRPARFSYNQQLIVPEERLMELRRLTNVTCMMLVCWCVGPALATTASYTVTFNAEWSESTHPGAYPPSAHFSALIGGVHNDQAIFWTPGELASAGIEQMAEIGGTTLLRGEVQAAIDSGNASAVLSGSGVPSPGSTSVLFQVSDEFPLITLVTMVAPTPDWFVGVHGFDLRDDAGWTNHAVVDLFAYDAGTEDGTGFSLSNPDTVPPQPIALLESPLAPSDPRLGTFTFSRNFVGRPMGDYNDDRVVDAADYVAWRNSVGESGVNLPADGDLDGAIDDDDYGIWLTHFGQAVPAAAVTAALGSTTVPEPASGLLLMCASAGLFTSRASRRRSVIHSPASWPG
jgi:hypothetical protein